MRRRDFLNLSGRWAVAAPLPAGLLGRRMAAEDGRRRQQRKRKPATGPLRTHPDNPRYFTDGTGKAVYLTGSHTWSNLVDMSPTDPPQPFDFEAYLGWLVQLGHNFTRGWTWETVAWDTRANQHSNQNDVLRVSPHPWARTGPGKARDGKPKFDLTRFCPDYFNRLRSRADAAGRRGIYLSIMLFEGWGLQFAPGAWEAHPMHPDNNVNGVNGDAAGDGKGLAVYTLAQPAVTALQEGYVKRAIDAVNDLDNVLYEISNENHPPSTKWQYHMVRLIQQYERGKPKRHPVGMTFQYRGGSNRTLLDSPADWISPNHEGGYRDNPPAADGRKIILSDTDHLWGIGGNADWVWKTFLRGMNPLFMDPYDGVVLGKRFDPKWEPIRKALGYTLRLAQRLDLARMAPRNRLASSAYCLANTAKPAAQYLVYLPEGNRVTVDLSATPGKFQTAWMRTSDGKLRTAGTTQGGASRDFAGLEGEKVLWLKAV